MEAWFLRTNLNPTAASQENHLSILSGMLMPSLGSWGLLPEQIRMASLYQEYATCFCQRQATRIWAFVGHRPSQPLPLLHFKPFATWTAFGQGPVDQSLLSTKKYLGYCFIHYFCLFEEALVDSEASRISRFFYCCWFSSLYFVRTQWAPELTYHVLGKALGREQVVPFRLLSRSIISVRVMDIDMYLYLLWKVKF